MRGESATTRRNGFPLSTLFVLIAVVASMFALLSAVVTDLLAELQSQLIPMLAAMIVGCGVCSLTCLFIAWSARRSFLDAVLGGVIGAFWGPVVGPLALVDVQRLTVVVWTAILGSLLIVVVSVLARATQVREHPAAELEESTGQGESESSAIRGGK